MRLRELTGKRVCILGLGREGLSVLNAVEKAGPAAIGVCDRDPNAGAKLPAWAIETVVVHHSSPDMLDAAAYDVVIKSPGIPPHNPGVLAARKAGAVVTTPTRLWFAEARGTMTIGVTGTKGKSTTATLIHRCLVDAGRNAHLFGNIGRPMLDLLPAAAGDDPVFVLELSSFQLFGLETSPRIAVLLNLYTDHLDWHASRDEYVDAKLNVCRHQGESDALIYHGTDEGIRVAKPGGRGRRVPFATLNGMNHADGWFRRGPERLIPVDALRLVGDHNRDNACAVLAAVEAAGVDPVRAEATFRAFEGLPHRLELIRERDGVRFVNDSIATGPDAAIRALDTFAGTPKIVILGGNPKGIPLEPLVARILRPDVKAVVLMQASGATLDRVLADRQNVTCIRRTARDMEDAVRLANELTTEGDVVLLAPGAASAPPFRDYADRGDQFRRAVWDL